MTREIADIIIAFKEAQRAGRQTALATVVHVEGSSYRRPGARMLVEDNGKITGAISGGCLEGDALQKALLAIHQQQNKLVTYNTLDEDDVKFGIQLGCNGIVHILFEPINAAQPDNPIALLEKSTSQRKHAVLVTLFSLKNYYGRQPGTCFFFDGSDTIDHLEDPVPGSAIKQEAASVLLNRSPSLLQDYPEHQLTAFIELLQPAVSLVLVGAGNDAMPLVDMATVLGWETTVIDGRNSHANKQRFSKAYQVIVGKPGDVIAQINIDERTFIVLMTHNYNYDLAMLELLLQRKCRYIGTLGPGKRLQRLLNELEQNGVVISEEQRNAIHGPIGLDIGAEGAEEIALSILAEIKAVLAGRQGSFLRDRPDVIHARPAPVEETKTGG
ncbi:MAG TPA: XdhC/CoxI family protein [Chitinophagaceae bacterium]